MSLEDVAVGDTLILSADRGRRTEVTVTKVGRKYLYVGQTSFRRSTGAINSDPATQWVQTQAQVAEADHRAALLAMIKELGMVPADYTGRGISTETLEAVLSALRGEAP
jgi:hypothetical protein